MNPPLDLLDVALGLADLLDELRVEYAFGGAIAQNYWGTVRATDDVDILVALPRIRFQEVERRLNETGFTMIDPQGRPKPISVESMVAQERERHLFVVYKDLVKVEVFLPFLQLQHSILRRAVKLTLGNRAVPISTAEDIILLKMAFHREKDLLDVRGILWNQGGKLDLAYLREWAQKTLADERIAELETWIERYRAARRDPSR